ncbi:MAG: hypothetical protein A4S09_14245 [Proteobacteria bacterium SG_bin7]|nr:MAG: hypothetical protein A4S09_14245 [Proteobacteria bacterium SG_bin7]
MKQAIKFLGVLTLIGIFISISVFRYFFSRGPLHFRLNHRSISQRFSIWALYLLGLKVFRRQPKGLDLDQNYFTVANHMSYIDVLVINSFLPSCFVTSQEIRETFGLGLLTEVAGCIFVERRNKLKLGNEIEELSRALDWGINVCVFPEATSTNGETVLPFKKPLFRASVIAEVPILPITINYDSVDGKGLSTENRDIVCWYGDMDFLSHLWNLCGRNNIKCRVEIHTPIEISERATLQELSEFSRERVVSTYVPIVNSPLTIS